ncbi:hypothetical protein L0P32_20510, partial [[Clostridium] scindens]|nr:hypothetical protein [[Clostridium] scindens]MCG4931178.1 hypothetical protein [[Clostridium] scindens]
FYLNASGSMATGWAKIDNAWYYFNASGFMQKSRWIGNYYVESDGKMAVSKWIGNYYVGSDGKWVPNKRK